MIPSGFRLAGVYSGIKRNPEKFDVALVVAERDAVAAGVYTTNRVFAAPVAFDRARTPMANFRVLAINSGNANACTGEAGYENAVAMARLAAEKCGVDESSALVMSTGIIGEPLPMEKIAAGIQAAALELANDEPSLIRAAKGMLTTDTRHKVAHRQFTIGNRSFQLTGMAKGAGMIGPKMATMLGILMTDAPLAPNDAQAMLQRVADDTFNCISVEGHTSTNDTVLLLASGAAGGNALSSGELAAFERELYELCETLARSIPDDGEGVTHLMTIEARGCAAKADARKIAETIANSPLVKTAVAGNDPNWGRIVSAAGYAGVEFDPAKVDLQVNGMALYRAGTPLPFDGAAVSAKMKANRETSIVITFGEGTESARFWTCDLTAEYVKINADYHT